MFEDFAHIDFRNPALKHPPNRVDTKNEPRVLHP
jgi:hypothetical protein